MEPSQRVAYQELLAKGVGGEATKRGAKGAAEQEARFIESLIRIRPDFQKVSRQRVLNEIDAWSDFDRHKAAIEYGLDAEFRVTRKELLSSAKITELTRILNEQAKHGGKTLVFSQFTQMLDVVETAL